ncbi:MAG: SpoIIE family protein phosphatase [Clostridia bacterium]|nr:SpoIIE family protein phosphatase [Clostridia bacterium]
MRREGRIARRTLIGLILLAVIIVVAISTAISVQVRKEFVANYSDFALSYVNSAAEYIDGDRIQEYYKTGKADDYYEQIRLYLNVTAEKSADSANIQYFYVFIPGEDDFIYIWDADAKEEAAELLEHYPYSEGAKEQAFKMLNKEISEDVHYYIDAESGADILTVSTGVEDSKGNTVAIVAADLSVTGINDAISKVITGVIISVIGIMSVVIIAYYQVIRQKIVNPIETLNKTTENIIEHIENDETLSINIRTNDELERLANSFVEMNKRLKEYIRQNAVITAEKERIGAELSIAGTIQENAVPNIFPAFPERKDFDIYASMTPAKEVGGDFYNFFLVDDDHIALVMADVSGKGIPAALFMMVANILISDRTRIGGTPAEILEYVNNSICANNEADMFVTVWLGILELSTGKMIAANAGHDDPAVYRKGGDFEIIKNRHGIAIGALGGVHYKNFEIQLNKGDKIFLYTDGVPEATDNNEELFTISRMVQALNNYKKEKPQDIIDGINRSVIDFVGDAPQFDDLTMLCLELMETEDVDNMLTVEALNENLQTVMDFVDGFLEENGVSAKTQMQVDLSVEEIFVNIANYAYGNGTGTAEISVKSDGGEITVMLKDSGIPYNPLKKPDPDITLSTEERPIGGLGIFLTKKNMDTVTYEYSNNQNILTMTKKI